MIMRRFFIDKVENMRDIGGYTIGNKEIVREETIIRSNCITNLDDREIEELIQMNFTTIIDLRSNDEITNKKGIFVGNNKFNYYHVGIKGDGRLPNSKDAVLDSYIEMLEGKEKIKELFDILADTTSGVIYYCNAGKDRTGVVTACILKLLGVNEKDIIVDYLASGVFLKKMIIEFSNSVKEKDIFPIINPNYDTMDKLLKHIDNKYGSIEGYLKSCSISEENLKKIKKRYIEAKM